jgi:hypothetical protein
MDSFFPAIWNVLHDGIIVAIDGAVPGTIRLQVSIDYLRKRFSQSGELIQIVLEDCSRFTYRASDASGPTTELPLIADMAPEILSATLTDGLCEIECADGVLEVVATDGSVQLDSGHAVTLQELIDVADDYWREWSERAKRLNRKSE